MTVGGGFQKPACSMICGVDVVAINRDESQRHKRRRKAHEDRCRLPRESVLSRKGVQRYPAGDAAGDRRRGASRKEPATRRTRGVQAEHPVPALGRGDAPMPGSTAGCRVDERVGRYRPSGYNDR